MAIPTYPGTPASGPALRSEIDARFTPLYNFLPVLQLPSGGSLPSSPSTAQVYFYTSDNTVRVWNGTSWVTLQVQGTLSGPQTITGLLTPQGGIAGSPASAVFRSLDAWRPNMAVDPAFLSAGAYWTTVAGSGFTYTAQDSDAFIGKVDVPTGSPGASWWWIKSVSVGAAASQYWCASGLGNLATAANVSGIVIVAFYDGSGTILQTNTATFAADGSDHRVFVVGQAPASTATVAIGLGETGSGTSAGGWLALPKLEQVESAASTPSPWTNDIPIAPAISAGTLLTGLHAQQADSLGGTLEVEVLRLWGQQQGMSSSSLQYLFGSGLTVENLVNPMEIGKVSSAATYILEVRAEGNTVSGTTFAALYDMTAGAVASGSTITVQASGFTTFRSGAVALTAGHQYGLAFWDTGGATYELLLARLVAQI